MYKRSIKILLVFAIFFAFSLGNSLPILAATDTTPPTVKSISFDKEVVHPGEKVLIQVEAEDLESGIGENKGDTVIQLRKPGNANVTGNLYLTYNPATKKYEALYTIPIDSITGTWSINYISIENKVGNSFYSFPKFGDTLYKTFELVNGSNDKTPPTVNSISFDKAVVKPGEKVLIQVEAEDLESGIGENKGDTVIQLRKPGNANVTGNLYLTYNPSTKKYEALYTIPIDAMNGTWSINYINIENKVGNSFYSFPKFGDTLYKTFEVVNGSNDKTPPTVKSISFDKAVVKPGEKVLIQVEAEDLESGIGENKGDTVIQLRKPGNANVTGNLYLTYNPATKKYEALYTIPIDAMNGTWSINYISIENKVGNSFYSFPKLGDTLYKTFKVADDVIPPGAPNVNEVTNKSSSVTGKAEAGSTVTVKTANKLLGTTVAKEDGTFSVPIKLQPVETLLEVTATDKTENVSEVTKVTVKESNIVDFVDENLKKEVLKELRKTISVTDNITKEDMANLSNLNAQNLGIKDLTGLEYAINASSIILAGNEIVDISPLKNLKQLGILSLQNNKIKDITPISNMTGLYNLNLMTNQITDISPLVTNCKNGGFRTGNAINLTFNHIEWTEENLHAVRVLVDDYYIHLERLPQIDVKSPPVPKVNNVDNTSTSVTGEAEAGSTITIKAGEKELGTGVALDNETFSVKIDAQKEGTKLSVTATDNAGNKSEAKTVIVKDVIAPTAPHVDEVTDLSTSVSGTAETNSSIVVKIGSTVLGTTITNEGKFSVSIPKQKAGTKLTITATDDAGNSSVAKEVKVKETIIMDVTPPTAPTVDEVTETSTSVSGTAESGSLIKVKSGTAVIGTVTTSIDGRFTVQISKQKAGTKLAVTATDKAGNPSAEIEITVKDVTAPTVPTVNEVKDTSSSISGTAEADSIIRVKDGTTVIGTATANTDGKFTVQISKQKAGKKLTITATDKAGNISAAKEITIKDVTAPSTPTVNAVYDNATVITGKAESNANVYAMVGSKKIGEARANNGGYSIRIAKQKAGTSIVVHAVDAAGNKSGSNSVKVIDKTAPSVPSVNTVYDYSTAISGKAETNAKVYAMVGSTKIGEATSKSGSYSMKISKQKAGTNIGVFAIDTSGNKSSSKTVKVIDKTAPSAPSVNTVYDYSTAIAGKAETNAKVYAVVGTKTIGEATSKSGSYTMKISKQKAGTSIVVYAKDASGNKSSSRAVKVIDKTAPPVPTVNKITSKTVTVTGKSEKGASIFIYNGSKKIGQGIVDSRGNYKVKIKAQKKGSTIKVYAQDKSGNKSKSKTIKVS
ncbi:Ig-like domain-containing protein [Peribacillus sp. SI8-4]|uniref:Ig-like domain-containing protein n=1 Tax=Peribacillus sp. SI8-4 TaxID=3048009 RepID=UPI0025557FE2|nr:Ig-like domain-containing protein [Peribacillus sp. SI8-4]